MKLPRQFSITIRGRTLEHMHTSQIQFVGTTLAKLIAGEEIDPRDLIPYGLRVSVDAGDEP